jgi:hypothetical protein
MSDHKPGISTSVTIPLQISVTLGGAATAAKPAVPGVQPIQAEGLFGRRPPLDLTELATRFSADSLSSAMFTWRTALSLALASRLAYSPPAEIEAVARGSWGLDSCEFLESGDTQVFVASTATAILVAFRGTESLGDWLADLNALSTTRGYGRVHRGFYQAFLEVKTQLEVEIGRLSNRSIVLTGHSLGGALATVAAAEWTGRAVSGIYTYGQPRVGKSDFAAHITSNFGGSMYRFVNDDDIVPRVPPNFRHVGRLYHFNARGDLKSSESLLTSSPDTEPPALTDAEFDQLRAQLLVTRAQTHALGHTEFPVGPPIVEGFFPSISDHGIDRYIDKILKHTD